MPMKNRKKRNSKKQQEIDYRRSLVASYRITGMTQEQIKKVLERQHSIIVDRSTISIDCHYIDDEWKETIRNKTEEFKNETIIKYNRLELEAWSMYKKAQKDGDAGGNTAGYWHNSIIKTLDQKSKLLGLYANPATVEVKNYINSKPEELSDEELVDLINVIRIKQSKT